MWEIIMKMLLCLIIAAILGAIIGWLLRSLFCKKRCDELEANLSDRDREIADLRASLKTAKASATAENTRDDAEIASLKARIETLEAELAAKGEIDAEWQTRYSALETELGDWKSKAETVAPAAAVGLMSNVGDGGSDDEIARLRAEIETLRLRADEAESEKVFLLERVKRAESGESIARVVPEEERDDLELINGVGPVLERMLYDVGIYFFKDIAAWDAAKIAEMNEKLPNFRGRIEREGWVESAKEEHFKKYGERL